MAEQHTDDLLRQPAVNALRVAFGATAIVALILGYLGLDAFLTGSADFSHRPWDLLYYDFQLFVLGADPLQQTHRPYPVILQIARFAAPAVTLYAFVEGFRLLSAAEFRRLRARGARGHMVVCGDAPLADVLSRRLRAARWRVVDVRSAHADAKPSILSARLLVLGDPRDPNVLRAAGLDRAAALYACDADSAVNIATGLAAGQARRPSGQPLAVYAHIDDPELCLTLQARYLGLPQPAGLRLDFFNVDDLAARKLFVQDPLRPIDGRPPRLLVAGNTAFGRAVLVEAARHWRRAFDPEASKPLPIELVDKTAPEAVDELTHRYPFLGQACRLTVHPGDLLQLLADGVLRDQPDRVFVCHDNEAHALKTALTTERFWRYCPQSVLVRLDHLTAFSDELDPDGGGRLFAEASGKLRAYGVIHAASDPNLISEDLVERLARVIHDRYRAARHRRGDRPVTDRSMLSWDELPSALRQANRDQAEDIGRKLREIDCVLVPRVRQGEGGVLYDAEVQQLAMMEHERWRAKRIAAGWQYAEQRDDTRKLHPAVCDWPNLSEQMRLRNNDAVREVPMILAEAGFQIVRV